VPTKQQLIHLSREHRAAAAAGTADVPGLGPALGRSGGFVGGGRGAPSGRLFLDPPPPFLPGGKLSQSSWIESTNPRTASSRGPPGAPDAKLLPTTLPSPWVQAATGAHAFLGPSHAADPARLRPHSAHGRGPVGRHLPPPSPVRAAATAQRESAGVGSGLGVGVGTSARRPASATVRTRPTGPLVVTPVAAGATAAMQVSMVMGPRPITKKLMGG
jgi:hypothetical protein